MIKRIRIRDFKSIREVDLELDELTVLVGRSGTGKSNLVQAIRFLRNVLIHQDQAINYEFGWERIVPVGESRPNPTIEVCFTVPGEERDYRYRIGYGPPGQGRFPGPMVLREERLDLGSETLFSRSQKENAQYQWEQAPKLSPVPQPHANVPMLGLFPALQEVVIANAALSTGIGYYHFPATALTEPAPHHQGQEIWQKLPGLWDSGGNYLQIVREITQDFNHPAIRKGLLASLRFLNPSIDSVELDSLTSPQRAVVGHKAGGRVFALSLEQESDGLRRFYAHLLALYQTPAKLTLVFEEPENAIFPGALSVLADEFKAAPRDGRGQVILTTHNPILLDSFNVDNVRAVEMPDGNTIVGRVTEEQRQAVKDRLLTTGDLLTVDRARIEETAKANQAA